MSFACLFLFFPASRHLGTVLPPIAHRVMPPASPQKKRRHPVQVVHGASSNRSVAVDRSTVERLLSRGLTVSRRPMGRLHMMASPNPQRALCDLAEFSVMPGPSAAVQRRVALGRARESDRLCHAAGTATTWSGCFYRTPSHGPVAPDYRAAGPPMSPRQPRGRACRRRLLPR